MDSESECNGNEDKFRRRKRGKTRDNQPWVIWMFAKGQISGPEDHSLEGDERVPKSERISGSSETFPITESDDTE